MKIADLTVKQLVAVLRDLSPNQQIGFDPYRDPRTKEKQSLLWHIVSNFPDEAVIQSVLSTTRETIESPSTPPEYVPQTAPFVPKLPPAPSTDAASHAVELAQILTKIASTQSHISPENLKQEIALAMQEHLNGFIDTFGHIVKKHDTMLAEKIAAIQTPVTVHTHNVVTKETKDMGVQHKCFPVLLKAIQARTPDGHALNVWIKGPAGSGKTTAAKKCAEALDQKFWFNGAIGTQYELMGFIDAGGTYRRTPFRDAYEHGGVYLFDEIDSSNPNAVLSFNAALANGVCAFPDGMITRHKDCVILAGANTSGNGANADYVGRMKQDGAFLDRFVLLDWPLDEALEQSLTDNTAWLKRVQVMRAKAVSRGLKHMITPRATLFGASLLAAGMDQAMVEQMVLQKGLQQDSWKEIQ